MQRTARSRPRRGETCEITIDGLAYGGSGIGRLAGEDGKPGMAVFVPGSAPGDRLRVSLERVQRRHAEASIVQVLEPGRDRVAPTCAHYEQRCGGCSWQHLSYTTQLAAKETLVRDSLERIGGFGDLPMAPIIAAESAWWYRNKMEFAFNAQDGLGLHVSGDWRSVVPITDCRLQSELAMRIVQYARDFAAQHELPSWDPVTHEGWLRELVIRHGCGGNETMVALVTATDELPEEMAAFGAGAAALDDSIVSVLHAVRGGDSSGAPLDPIVTLQGRDTITEQVAGLTFDIGLQTFFQTNSAQAGRMVDVVRQQVAAGFAAAPDAPARLLDVFCGVGFFTLAVADLAAEVIGVEVVEASIAAARDNAARNGIDNASFYAGDARRTLPVVLEQHGAPGVVLLDPPRSGAGGKVMRRIARAAPWRIVYVSCNPTTLARDLQELHPFGYRIVQVQPIDLFPQTYHVETIVTVDLCDPAAAGPAPEGAADDE